MPTRRCAVCGKSREKKELLRFVLEDGAVVFDQKQVFQGRAAYLDKTAKCVLAFSVISILKASLSRVRLDKKSKKKNEKELILETLKNWSGLDRILENSLLEDRALINKAQSKIRL